jgi:phage terminase large subunit-like protein
MTTQRRSERLSALLALSPERRKAELKLLTRRERQELRHHWRVWAAPAQLPPESDWRIWLILAGRGFGKTRAGAEWIRAIAASDPAVRIALVGATLGEVRAVMVEGESGIIAISPRGRRPKFEPSLRRLTWPNGAQATLYSAAEPEALRGPQHSHACWPSSERGLRQRNYRPH